ncbi:hypothetical protein Bhyg_06635 [Pseudolycoriella hygida]|uniref:Uncharacterized protein n=1 Tax=Pseudolycoriella hygida TaxID=35572 RepID=A0A9Q0S312_9DIPT|nr:hypothetical protein Bhyg_06635 [Pseudolycoriella hygida]
MPVVEQIRFLKSSHYISLSLNNATNKTLKQIEHICVQIYYLFKRKRISSYFFIFNITIASEHLSTFFLCAKMDLFSKILLLFAIFLLAARTQAFSVPQVENKLKFVDCNGRDFDRVATKSAGDKKVEVIKGVVQVQSGKEIGTVKH